MPHAPVCSTSCWLEGLESARLTPPCSSYTLWEQLDPSKGLFLICRGPVGCLWGPEPERSCLEILGPGEIWEGWSCTAGECQAWALGEVQGHWIKHNRYRFS